MCTKCPYSDHHCTKAPAGPPSRSAETHPSTSSTQPARGQPRSCRQELRLQGSPWTPVCTVLPPAARSGAKPSRYDVLSSLILRQCEVGIRKAIIDKHWRLQTNARQTPPLQVSKLELDQPLLTSEPHLQVFPGRASWLRG